MTRRDGENEEKPKSLLGLLFRREKAEQPEGGTPEESRTGEIQLGGEEPEEPSDLELVLALEEKVAGPKPEQPKPAEPVSTPQPEPEKPQKPAGPLKAPEPPAPKPEKKPAEKQAASRKRRSSTSRAPRRSSTRTGRCRRSKPCCLVQSFRRRRKSLPSR